LLKSAPIKEKKLRTVDDSSACDEEKSCSGRQEIALLRLAERVRILEKKKKMTEGRSVG